MLCDKIMIASISCDYVTLLFVSESCASFCPEVLVLDQACIKLNWSSDLLYSFTRSGTLNKTNIAIITSSMI